MGARVVEGKLTNSSLMNSFNLNQIQKRLVRPMEITNITPNLSFQSRTQTLGQDPLKQLSSVAGFCLPDPFQFVSEYNVFQQKVKTLMPHS